MLLFVDACARPQSRTLKIAENIAKKLSADWETVNLYEEKLLPLDYCALLKRDKAAQSADFSDEMFRFAKQFKEADEILVAAPFWDLSFPSILKCYFEAVCVNGVTFVYNEKGVPEGLCKAKRLVYVTTAGGFIPENNYGYNYVKQLCTDFFGIKETTCIKAEGLDIQGADVEKIVKAALDEADLRLFE